MADIGAMGLLGAVHSGPSDLAFEKLYPAIVECFAIILCGYVAGRMNVITQTEAKGLNTFVGTFSLPSLIFMSMATLDFSSVNWHFLLAVFVAKAAVFTLVVIISLLVTRPTDLSRSGLYAIFCTQSNDFALGYPIVAALYSTSHPEYPSYLYLAAPISLVLLNPFAFFLMELGKRREEVSTEITADSTDGAAAQISDRKPAATLVKILTSIFLNPIILMTALGICGNFAFRQCIPVILEGILKVFGSSFSAAALFMLGLRMVGKMHRLKGANFIVPGILIGVKCLVLPLVTRELVSLLQSGVSSSNETSDLSDFGFLYGTFPTAPGVFVYSTQFNVDPDLIASAMVACTFLSAPLMFVSAKMVTLTHLDPKNYIGDLDSFVFNLSIVGLISTSWVIGVFLLSKKWKKIPHFFTMCLAISQFLGCLGVLLWSVLGCCDRRWQVYLQFVLTALGVFGSRLWTALLALSLYLLRTRSLCFVLQLRTYFAVAGWGIPSVIAVLLLATVGTESDDALKSDPNFQYGNAQAIAAVVVLLASFFVTVTCLIMQQRYGKRYHDYQSVLTEDDSGASESTVSVRDIEDHGNVIHRRESVNLKGDDSMYGNVYQRDLSTITEHTEPSTDLISSADTDSLLFSPASEFCSSRQCDVRQQQQCSGALRRYQSVQQLTQPEETSIVRDRDDEYQIFRHIVLILILCCSMIVGIALCTWTIIVEQVSGIYLELLFLDAILNFGQGFFVCLVFGFDTRLVFAPILKRWRRLRNGAQGLALPKWDTLDPETKHICQQFLTYHMDKCVRDLVRDRRWRLKWYRSVFVGTEMVDWLILVGLAHDRSQAVRYGHHLLSGRVIRHINNEYHFYDQPFFYTFVSSSEHVHSPPIA